MGIKSKKWIKRDVLKELKNKLDEIVKNSEENAKQFSKDNKDMMIRHELFIQEYAKTYGEQQMLDESMERLAAIQNF